MFFIALAVVLTAVSAVAFKRDPRRLVNGLVFVAALTAWLLGALSLLNRLEVRVEAVLIVIAATFIFLAVIGVISAAAVNGVVVIRREGLRLATVLPLAFAVVTVSSIGFLTAIVALLESHSLPLWFLACVWTAVLFAVGLAIQLAAFAVHALIYGHIEPPRGSAAVVALGCGLGAGGSVTPLLASRVNRALEVYRAELDAGNRPALVMSGGQGTDESTAEATAMKNYLTSRGLAADQVLAETQSRTTHENLVLTKKLLDSRELSSEPMIIVTSDFHVLRTAAFTRDLGLAAHVTGARTARFYAPTAFLREFAAILRRYWKANAALLLGILVFVVFLQNVN
ncbi:YdcF family protein [Rhodococcus sp. G-MC3]|uniref:YdcF family protein n=1 Tax=Rhodococcus sp. G-MC3 TaxID=3046209 RepID=UPI0024BA1A4F|nr:YdcF family protein [Rhodococcus sp. G-MC3]MDJ0395030.1 YdcF family protein [Rhodococcus sp. G-MC3]